MAPMAGTIADTENHRLILLPGLVEGFVAPGVPVHRVAGVLEEIGGFFVYEAVGLFLGRLHGQTSFAFGLSIDK
jgi:hypothetical protein